MKFPDRKCRFSEDRSGNGYGPLNIGLLYSYLVMIKYIINIKIEKEELTESLSCRFRMIVLFGYLYAETLKNACD